MAIDWGALFGLAIEIAKEARSYLSEGSSKKLSRATQKATKQAFRNRRDITPGEFSLAKTLASTYTVEELERFFKRWRECHNAESEKTEAEQVRAARVRSCCCDLLRAMRDYSGGKLPKALRAHWKRYGC